MPFMQVDTRLLPIFFFAFFCLLCFYRFAVLCFCLFVFLTTAFAMHTSAVLQGLAGVDLDYGNKKCWLSPWRRGLGGVGEWGHGSGSN